MSWTDIGTIVLAVVTGVVAILGGMWRLLERSDKHKEADLTRIAAAELSVHALEVRVLALELLNKNAPNWDTLNTLKGSHSRIEGELNGLTATVDGMKDQQGYLRESVTRIENHLLGSKS